MNTNLKPMSIEELVALRDEIEATLESKVADERRTLELELAKLTRFSGGSRSKSLFGRGARGMVAPKYRNPENPSETWAGRGLKPRWLTAALESGKKLDDFRIAAAGKQAPAAPVVPATKKSTKRK